MSDFIPTRMKHCFPITNTSKITVFREIIVILSLHAVGAIPSLFTLSSLYMSCFLSDLSYELRDRLHPTVAYFETLLQRSSKYI